MRGSEGGFSYETILDMDLDEFGDWFDSVVELEKRIADASKVK